MPMSQKGAYPKADYDLPLAKILAILAYIREVSPLQ